MLGDHGDAGKTMPWEGSAHVPLVVAGPMVLPSRKLAVPVTIMDLAATFIDYGGAVLAPGASVGLFHSYSDSNMIALSLFLMCSTNDPSVHHNKQFFSLSRLSHISALRARVSSVCVY